MKITTDKAVYVQKNDLGYLFSSDIPIPASIYLQAAGPEFMIINDTNRYDFVKFEEDSEIEYFNGMDWMVEYSEVKDLPVGDILGLEEDIITKRNGIASKFNEMSQDEKKKNYSMVQQCELLQFKMFSLNDIVKMKSGKLSIELPEGIDYPKEYKRKMKFKSIFRKNK